MTALIENVITIKEIDLDRIAKESWTELVKTVKKAKTKWSAKLKKSQIWQRIKNFARQNWIALTVAAGVLTLYATGFLPITIFIFVL